MEKPCEICGMYGAKCDCIPEELDSERVSTEMNTLIGQLLNTTFPNVEGFKRKVILREDRPGVKVVYEWMGVVDEDEEDDR